MFRLLIVLSLLSGASSLAIKASKASDGPECDTSINLARACGPNKDARCPVLIHGNNKHNTPPGRINDGTRSSAWTGQSGSNCWVRVDLESGFKVNRVDVYAGLRVWTREYGFRGTRLYLSENENMGEPVVSVGGYDSQGHATNCVHNCFYKNTMPMRLNTFPETRARYVWFEQPHCSIFTLSHTGFFVAEVEVYGCPMLSGHGHGDPHLTNIKGESFDVMQEGNMVLLETPRGSTSDSLNLGLRADIDRLGAVKCGPTYITAVQLDGKWLGRGVQISSGKVFKQPFEQESEKHSFGIRVGDDPFFSHVTFISQSQGHLELPAGASIQTTERTFIVKAKGLTILVQQPRRPRIFLDVQVTGLETLTGEVGGLLGVDDHASAEEVPPECM